MRLYEVMAGVGFKIVKNKRHRYHPNCALLQIACNDIHDREGHIGIAIDTILFADKLTDYRSGHAGWDELIQYHLTGEKYDKMLANSEKLIRHEINTFPGYLLEPIHGTRRDLADSITMIMGAREAFAAYFEKPRLWTMKEFK